VTFGIVQELGEQSTGLGSALPDGPTDAFGRGSGGSGVRLGPGVAGAGSAGGDGDTGGPVDDAAHG